MIKVETFIQMLGNYTRPPQRIYLIYLGAKLYMHFKFYKFELFGRKCNL
jgi:hypothetical protein